MDLDASRHDRLMSIIQAGCHAGWLAQAKMWSETVPDLGGLAQLLAVRTPSFALLEKAVARIMCGNPEMYVFTYGIMHDVDIACTKQAS